MQKSIILLIFALFFGAQANAQTSKRVLFLGNSYTYVNNLPQITADIATSMQDTLFFDANNLGGYTLRQHSTNAVSRAKIAAGNWNFVVLQEQSQLPSFPINDVQNLVFPYATRLDSLINAQNVCTETMFYRTWGRKNGDAQNCPNFAPVCTYRGMDSLLNERYLTMANLNHAVVSPVGAVWKYLRQHHANIELYDADESHPSQAGSYAAACCFYTAIFRRNPLLIPYNYSLSAADADAIKNAVKQVVFDDFSTWHIGQYDALATKNEPQENSLKCYPNPAFSTISIDLPSKNIDKMQVFNNLGQGFNPQFHIADNTISLDIAHLPLGIYFINIEINGKKWTGKFIK